VLWSGVPLCVAGMAINHLGAQWHPGRFGELIVLAVVSLAGAWILRRILRWPVVNGLLLQWALALPLFAGVMPTLATMLLSLAALALGGLIARDGPPALRIACGLVVAAGALGWLLPLPVHYRFAYLGLCLGLIAWQWRSLRETGRQTAAAWSETIAAAPGAALFAVLLLGLASTGTWVPTLQADDVVYHLRLPWQLLEQHHYPLRPDLHIWSMAPWAADVLQAIPQLIAGAEARGSVNALWIGLTAAGVFRVAMQLGASHRSAWYAVALYASLPLTASLAGGMQTETPTTALLAWLAWTILDSRGRHRIWIGAVLAGGLLALKLSSVAFVLLLLPWALWVNRRDLPRARALAGALAVVAAIAGSSYTYAALVAGNPVLPLFNAFFESPYFDRANFDDARWHAGFNAALPWNLTFDTGKYLEAYDGGGGFVLVSLAGAWLIALLHRRSAAMAIAVATLMAVPLLPMQYLRYIFPALVLSLPLLAVTAFRVEPRRAAWLIAFVCVLNLAFQSNAYWLLRTGLVKMSVRDVGQDAPAFRKYLPERNLIAAIRATAHGNVLAMDAERPYVAELGIRGRSTSYYDRTMQQAVAQSGDGLEAVLHEEGVTDVLLNTATATPTQRGALAKLGAVRRQEEGGIEWWHIPQAGR
jgi:hypothetical protein